MSGAMPPLPLLYHHGVEKKKVKLCIPVTKI